MIDEGRDRATRRIREACRFPVYASIAQHGKSAAAGYDALARKRTRLLGEVVHFYERPLHFVRGYRSFLYDFDARRYLDMVNNVCHVGHCHPRVVRAAGAQMARKGKGR